MIRFTKKGKIKIFVICMLIIVLPIAGITFAMRSGNDENGGGYSNITEETSTAVESSSNRTQNMFELTRTMSVFHPLRDDDKRIVYLTFDDGPSHNVTPEILRILREHNVPATFFVIGYLVEQRPEIIRQMIDEGHSIANHTFTHNFRHIYSSPQALIAEIEKTEAAINAALGFEYRNRLFRFPGGSHPIRREFKEAVLDYGMQFVDWNVVGNDSVTSRPISPELILQNTLQTVRTANAMGEYQLTVLLHDNSTRTTTAQALPMIIEHFKAEGYEFRTLCEM